MQKLQSSLNESLNESLNQRLQAKYPHLELAVLPLSEVNKGNESKRIDSEYFKKEYLENEKLLLNLNSVKLSNFCSFICNGDDCRDYDENGLKYIRTGDIKDYGLDLYNCATIRDNFISNTKLEIGDLLITRKGNYGKSQVVNNKEILDSIISSEIFQLKLKEINPYFVDIFLKSKFGQIQFEKNIHGVSNFSVTQEALLNFLIPQFSQDFQLEIEKLVKDSHKALEDSKALYKEAENLLYESLGLNSTNPLESLMRDTLATSCHTEALAEVSKNDSVDLVDSKDTHAKAPSAEGGGTKELHSAREGEKESCHDLKSPLPQHEGHLGVGSTCGDNVYCHLKRSEVSKSKGVDFVDTSAFSKPQYDKVLKSRNDENSPSLAEGARGWVNTRNDENSPLFVGGQSSSPSLTRGDSEFSPSLAEGVRGWVNTRNDDIATKYPHLNISIRTLVQSYGKSGRLDSEYYQSKYDAIERKIKGYKGGYCKLESSEIKDTNFTPKTQEKYRYIELANIGNNGNISEPLEDLGENLPTRARRKVKTRDFIMSSIEGSLASCAIITPEFDNCLVSTGFYVLNSTKLNSETLLVLFKCAFFQEHLKKFPSGTILTAISKDELQNILIPKIDSTTQEQIASKIQKSFALRKVAKDLLESAKSKVECAIEQGAR